MLSILLNNLIIITGQIVICFLSLFIFGAVDTFKGLIPYGQSFSTFFYVICMIGFLQMYFLIGFLLINIQSYGSGIASLIIYIIIISFGMVDIENAKNIIIMIGYSLPSISGFGLLLLKNNTLLSLCIVILFPITYILLGIFYKMGVKRIFIANLIITILYILIPIIYNLTN